MIDAMIVNQMGATQFTVGLSASAQFLPGKSVNHVTIKKISGGTLSIVQGISFITTQGYVMGDTEAVSVMGPASFFLAAAGTPVVVGVMVGYSRYYGSTAAP